MFISPTVITWLPDGKTFLSISEGGDVVKADLDGNILDQFILDQGGVSNATVTLDSLWLICIASGKERWFLNMRFNQLFVYNLLTHKLEVEMPVPEYHSVLRVGQDTQGNAIVLVSTGDTNVEEHATNPPQLWTLDVFQNQEMNGADASSQLTLKHTYKFGKRDKVSGPSYFGGKDNSLVLSTSQARGIYIWDQGSGILLGLIKLPEGFSLYKPVIAWNHASDNQLMFAVGNSEGEICTYTEMVL